MNKGSILNIQEIKEIWGKIYRIALGCPPLDKLLDGGFPSSHVTLIYGERSSGKTQLCHQLVAHYLTVERNHYAVYIDVDLTFSPSRIVSIVKKFGVQEPRDVLSRILYYKPPSFEDQVKVVDLLYSVHDKAPHKLIIIDSISTLIRGEYGSAVIEMQRALSNYIKKLQEYALQKNVVVIVTDNVHLVKQLDKELLLPVSLYAMEISVTHLRLIRGMGAKRICRVEASPVIPEGEAAFLIAEEGLIEI